MAKLAPRFTKASRAHRHLNEPIRNFGSDKCKCKQRNKLDDVETFAGKLSIKLKDWPMKQVQAVRPLAEIDQYWVAKDSCCQQCVRVHSSSDDCDTCKPDEKKTTLE